MKEENRGIFLWGGILLFIIILSVFANIFTAYDADLVDLSQVFRHPNKQHIFGTDNMGRDIFTRIIYGGRVSLSVSILSVVISTILGILFGGISGYLGGIFDNILMRILDALLAIPSLIIMLALQAIIQGGVVSMILIIGFTGWMSTARIVRSQFLELKEKEFVKVAVIMGTPLPKIMIKHLLRNSLSGVFVIAIFNCAHAVFTEVSLSFLGIGVPPSMPSWGNMLSNAQNEIFIGAWWVAVFPGIIIVISMLSINFLGESLKKKYGLKGGIN